MTYIAPTHIRPSRAARLLRRIAARIALLRATRALRDATATDHVRRDVRLDHPGPSSLTPSFDAADRLSIRANGGAGFHR